MHINSSAPKKKKKKKNFYIDSTKRRCQAKIKLALALKSHGVLSQQLFCFLLKKKDSSVQWALQGRIPISSNTNFVHLKTKKSH